MHISLFVYFFNCNIMYKYITKTTQYWGNTKVRFYNFQLLNKLNVITESRSIIQINKSNHKNCISLKAYPVEIYIHKRFQYSCENIYNFKREKNQCD